jgi:hypothetical protein
LIGRKQSQKITFEFCEMGVRGVLIYCADYHCSRSVTLSADRACATARGLLAAIEWTGSAGRACNAIDRHIGFAI